MNFSEKIDMLKTQKLGDYKLKVAVLRNMMKIIGKNNITLNTSEPIGPGHTYGLDKKYSLSVSADKITFLNNSNQTIVVDDAYINSCKWFQVYIYIVEIELELNKIYNQIEHSVLISQAIFNEDGE